LVGWGAGAFSGRGSVTMQPASKGKGKVKPARPKKPKPSKAPMKTGGANAGLTISEQVARAKKRVDAVTADITKARTRLNELARQLVEAERQLEAAQSLPRRSAAGRAAVKAVEEPA
jgi:hypothetical protein